MIEIINRVLRCINAKQKKKLFLLQALSLLSALFNVLSVLMFAPFIALLTNQKIILESKIFKIFDGLISMQSEDLVLYFSLVLIFLLVISTLSNLFINYLNLKWSADLQIYFSSTLYNYYINRDWIFHANTSTNDLIGKIHSDTQRLTSTVITPFVELVTNSIFSVFLFIAILLVDFKRVENSDDENKEKKLEILNKKDTLGKIGYDSVVIADFDESLKSVTTSLLYTDVSPKKIKFISLNQWFDETLFKETASQPISFPSINKENFDQFKKDYKKFYKNDPNQLSLITYDLVGLVYYLLVQNNFEVNENIFKEENKIKGISGVFEIKNKKINHELNFYSVESDAFIKIF